MTRKKIAILLPCLKFGGAERVSLNLARALQEDGCNVDILLMIKEGEFLAEAEAEFRVFDLGCNRTYKLPGKLVSYLWKNRPDALISSFWKLNICSCLAKIAFPGLKLVLWEHSLLSRNINSNKWLFIISASLLYRIADKIVAVSTGVFSDIDRLTIGLRRTLIVIFNPIRPPEPQKSVKSDFCGNMQVISVGRIDKNKNHQLLIEAFALVAIDRPVKLVIIGDGVLRPELEKLCSDMGLSGRVEFLGYHPDPYQIMLDSDLLVVSSDREGLPSVMIEAMYCGLPVISTDCGAGVEDILVGGRYGRIVPRNDKYALARGIEAELQNRRPSETQKYGAMRFLPRLAAQQFLNAMR